MPHHDALNVVADLLRRLGGRAAGYWELEGDRLVQVAFVPASDMPAETASRFAGATQAVPLDRPDLGIVRAAIDGSPAVSRADELPPETGSGYWLRAFGAGRSVAVPIGRPARGVLSVALPASDRSDDDALARAISEAGAVIGG